MKVTLTRNEFVSMYENKTAGEIFDSLEKEEMNFKNSSEVLKFLKRKHKAFKKNTPLGCNIYAEIKETYPSLEGMSRLLTEALMKHTTTKKYLWNIQKESVNRVHLDGSFSEVITLSERTYSLTKRMELYPIC